MPLRFQPNDGDTFIALRSETAISFRAIVLDDWTIVDAASYNVLPTDIRLWVTVVPCTITFPLSSTITYDVLIKDGTETAGTSNIDTAFSGGETCDGQANVPINSDAGWVIIAPKPVGSGYTQTG